MYRIFNFVITGFIVLSSCHHTGDTHRQENKIFHAVMSREMGDLYFGLYKDSTYQICARGRIAQDCFSGKYDLKGDTLTLLNLSPDVNLKYNRLLIVRYGQALRPNDSTNGPGNVFLVDNDNKVLSDSSENRFVIKTDSLKYFR